MVFINKSNIKFLALLSALASCTPALGAMKNNDVIQKKSGSACSWIKPMMSSSWIESKPILPSVYCFPKEEINTFGKPELDIFALCCSLNADRFGLRGYGYDLNSVREYIASHFDEMCELNIRANPGVKLKWKGNFDLLGFQFPDNRTIEISVRDGNSGRTFVIVGKLYVGNIGCLCYFYVKDLDTHENNITKLMIDHLMDVDWDALNNSDDHHDTAV